ncbi:hypothetical protein P154DRAFT_579054 [Amniculicola lignicola CBS 123094]|uniref:Uncharacterized protein n=1 Tax=Amniculicola lignicola CBS 123094 TaxID=1392246 RepID=A0A6A5W603_9PLEO|nr:hypothetical protein P154DRAFT_579054 [Amniculicola lignicola CBS 123094]
MGTLPVPDPDPPSPLAEMPASAMKTPVKAGVPSPVTPAALSASSGSPASTSSTSLAKTSPASTAPTTPPTSPEAVAVASEEDSSSDSDSEKRPKLGHDSGSKDVKARQLYARKMYNTEKDKLQKLLRSAGFRVNGEKMERVQRAKRRRDGSMVASTVSSSVAVSDVQAPADGEQKKPRPNHSLPSQSSKPNQLRPNKLFASLRKSRNITLHFPIGEVYDGFLLVESAPKRRQLHFQRMVFVPMSGNGKVERSRLDAWIQAVYNGREFGIDLTEVERTQRAKRPRIVVDEVSSTASIEAVKEDEPAGPLAVPEAPTASEAPVVSDLEDATIPRSDTSSETTILAPPEGPAKDQADGLDVPPFVEIKEEELKAQDHHDDQAVSTTSVTALTTADETVVVADASEVAASELTGQEGESETVAATPSESDLDVEEFDLDSEESDLDDETNDFYSCPDEDVAMRSDCESDYGTTFVQAFGPSYRAKSYHQCTANVPAQYGVAPAQSGYVSMQIGGTFAQIPEEFLRSRDTLPQYGHAQAQYGEAQMQYQDHPAEYEYAPVQNDYSIEQYGHSPAHYGTLIQPPFGASQSDAYLPQDPGYTPPSSLLNFLPTDLRFPPHPPHTVDYVPQFPPIPLPASPGSNVVSESNDFSEPALPPTANPIEPQSEQSTVLAYADIFKIPPISLDDSNGFEAEPSERQSEKSFGLDDGNAQQIEELDDSLTELQAYLNSVTENIYMESYLLPIGISSLVDPESDFIRYTLTSRPGGYRGYDWVQPMSVFNQQEEHVGTLFYSYKPISLTDDRTLWPTGHFLETAESGVYEMVYAHENQYVLAQDGGFQRQYLHEPDMDGISFTRLARLQMWIKDACPTFLALKKSPGAQLLAFELLGLKDLCKRVSVELEIMDAWTSSSGTEYELAGDVMPLVALYHHLFFLRNSTKWDNYKTQEEIPIQHGKTTKQKVILSHPRSAIMTIIERLEDLGRRLPNGDRDELWDLDHTPNIIAAILRAQQAIAEAKEFDRAMDDLADSFAATTHKSRSEQRNDAWDLLESLYLFVEAVDYKHGGWDDIVPFDKLAALTKLAQDAVGIFDHWERQDDQLVVWKDFYVDMRKDWRKTLRLIEKTSSRTIRNVKFEEQQGQMDENTAFPLIRQSKRLLEELAKLEAFLKRTFNPKWGTLIVRVEEL